MKSGIYRINNLLTNDCYIGKSNNAAQRLSQHRCNLNKRVHENSLLLNSYIQCGAKEFKFEVIEKCSSEMLLCREVYWITKLNPTLNNILPSQKKCKYHLDQYFQKLIKGKIRFKEQKPSRQRKKCDVQPIWLLDAGMKVRGITNEKLRDVTKLSLKTISQLRHSIDMPAASILAVKTPWLRYFIVFVPKDIADEIRISWNYAYEISKSYK